MKKLLTIIAISACLMACNDNGKKEFLTHSPSKAVIDISEKTVFFNGVSIPDIYDEMEKSEDLLTKGLDESLRTIRSLGAREVNIHVDSAEQFNFLFKAMMAVGFSGYTNFKTALGDDYNSIFEFNLPNRAVGSTSTKLPECYEDVLRLTKIRGGGVVKSRSTIMYNKSEEGALHEIICSSKADDAEKYRASQKLEIIKKRKIGEYVALSAEYVSSCQEQKIQGSCWKIESNDLVQPLFLQESDMFAVLQAFMNANKESIRKDKNVVTIVLPENISIGTILPALRKTRNMGFFIQFAVASDAIWVQ